VERRRDKDAVRARRLQADEIGGAAKPPCGENSLAWGVAFDLCEAGKIWPAVGSNARQCHNDDPGRPKLRLFPQSGWPQKRILAIVKRQ